VPACGAGTANTEFELLTGISAKFFGPGEYPYKGRLRENTLESMAYVAKRHGYATSALHNHRALFYNRNEVYADLGFDTFTSVEYMNNVSFTPTNWCKDTVLTDEIMEIMKQTKERDLLHVISVEGHGGYPTERVFKNPYTEITADDEDTKWKYEYYFNEMHEMDCFIGDLIEEIEASL
jgi:phosphoglycerol transferase MdoB-like AlkP superfamily enzyme